MDLEDLLDDDIGINNSKVKKQTSSSFIKNNSSQNKIGSSGSKNKFQDAFDIDGDSFNLDEELGGKKSTILSNKGNTSGVKSGTGN